MIYRFIILTLFLAFLSQPSKAASSTQGSGYIEANFVIIGIKFAIFFVDWGGDIDPDCREVLVTKHTKNGQVIEYRTTMKYEESYFVTALGDDELILHPDPLTTLAPIFAATFQKYPDSKYAPVPGHWRIRGG